MDKQMTRNRRRAMLPVIFGLAWPTMLEQLMQTAVQYIDTAMVGVLGTQATAAVGSTTTVNWLVGSFKLFPDFLYQRSFCRIDNIYDTRCRAWCNRCCDCQRNRLCLWRYLYDSSFMEASGNFSQRKENQS